MLDIEQYVFDEFDNVYKYGSPLSDYRVDCPFCADNYGSDDTKHKMYISVNKHVVHCFRCGYSASWIKFVMDNSGVPYYHAIGRLNSLSLRSYSDVGNLLQEQDRFKIPGHGNTRASLPNGFIPLSSDNDSRLLKAARRYITKRGFTRRHMVRYNLGVSDELGYRVIIPVEDSYYQARSVYKFIEPKYLNPKAEAQHYIFNSIALKVYEEVVIAEGCFSAMAVGDNAVAVLGKDVPDAKFERLVDSKVKRFIVALDADAHAFSSKLADRLVSRGKEVSLWLYDEGDPADNTGHTEIGYNFKTRVSMLMTNSRKSH